jgi:hypothetical protein
MKYTLSSSETVGAPGLVEYCQRMAKQDRRGAFFHLAFAFPQLPALLLYDILDARVPVARFENAVEIEWDKPLASTDDYLFEWKAFSFVVDEPKLGWIEAILDDKKIPHRRVAQEKRDVPRLEVPIENYDEASKIWNFRIQGSDKPVRDIPTNDPVFRYGGAGWNADLVDEDPFRPIATDKDA